MDPESLVFSCPHNVYTIKMEISKTPFAERDRTKLQHRVPISCLDQELVVMRSPTVISEMKDRWEKDQ